MAMRKADMEAHYSAYAALISEARAACRNGLYRKAIELALDSWEHIDGMMRYARKYEGKEFKTIDGLDIVLKYAPMLFDFRSMNRLEVLLGEQRCLEKNTSQDVAEMLAKARSSMWYVHRLWEHLERCGDATEDKLKKLSGGSRATLRTALDVWEKMGLLRRQATNGAERISLATRMGEVVSGKCPVCGCVAEAPKAILLEKTECPSCQRTEYFVLLSKT